MKLKYPVNEIPLPRQPERHSLNKRVCKVKRLRFISTSSLEFNRFMPLQLSPSRLFPCLTRINTVNPYPNSRVVCLCSCHRVDCGAHFGDSKQYQRLHESKAIVDVAGAGLRLCLLGHRAAPEDVAETTLIDCFQHNTKLIDHHRTYGEEDLEQGAI